MYKYDFLTRFADFNYWDYIELFQSAKLLSLIDPHRFEKLALIDKTKLILLNMTSYHLNVEPSEDLIKELLMDKDELKQNIGFYFITRPISRYLTEIEYIKRCAKVESYHGKSLKDAYKVLKTALNMCYTFLKNCDKKAKAALITNFLLVHQTIYPIALARELVGSKLQNEFIYQIKSTGKVKTLKDVVFLTGLISNTPAINEKGRRISKNKLYGAVTDVIISFIDERNGIYGWNEQQSKYMELICQRLPIRYIRKLENYLNGQDKTLMYNGLDEMVRFHIYLEDKRQHEIISGILKTINTLIK